MRKQFRSTVPTPINVVPPPQVVAMPPYFPPKLQATINARLTPECTPEGASLHRHLHTTHDYIMMKQQPDLEVTKGDRNVIETLIKCENARQSGLNLSYYPSLSAFANWLAANQNLCKQHVRAIVATAEDKHHHYYVDCYFTKPGQQSSLIIIESATIMHPAQQYVLGMFQGELDVKKLGNLSVAVIDINVQRSPADCVIFCMSFALKSFKHKELFAHMHQHHCAEGSLREHEIPIKASHFHIYPVYRGALLPADFTRHTHARTSYRNIFVQLPPEERRDASFRANELYQERSTERGNTSYLVSIEHKRLQLLRRALIQLGAISET